jgi:G3E family GTPase
MGSEAPVPVTLLTGFLGAGKTTLLNRILSDPSAGRVAVVVNEFGELGVDGSLVVGADEDVVELSNGCICCTVRGDLARSLNRLLDRRGRWLRPLRFDRLVIELSGMASPGPVVQTLVLDDGLRERLLLDGIVALVSAPDLTRQLVEHPEAAEQVGYADLVLVNHCDRASSQQVADLEAELAGRNPLARIERSVRAELPLESLLAIRTTAAESWELESSGAVCAPDCDEPGHTQAHRHSHDVEALGFESVAPLDIHRLKVWLQFVASRRDSELIRLKGLLRCAGQERVLVAQAVYQWLEIAPGAAAAPETSRLVLIGRGLDREALERGWRQLEAPAG